MSNDPGKNQEDEDRMHEFTTLSGADTIEVGRQLVRVLKPPQLLILRGDLGTGKTTLVKGIAQALDAAEADEVTSPTFTLIHEYGEGRVYHVDLYRLDEPREVATLGLEEIFDRDSMVLIEWGERFPRLLPANRTEIRIRPVGEDEREIEVRQT